MDWDADGQSYPSDTYTGFHEMGFDALSIPQPLGLLVPARLGYPWLPGPPSWAYVGSVHKAAVS